MFHKTNNLTNWHIFIIICVLRILNFGPMGLQSWEGDTSSHQVVASWIKSTSSWGEATLLPHLDRRSQTERWHLTEPALWTLRVSPTWCSVPLCMVLRAEWPPRGLQQWRGNWMVQQPLEKSWEMCVWQEICPLSVLWDDGFSHFHQVWVGRRQTVRVLQRLLVCRP